MEVSHTDPVTRRDTNCFKAAPAVAKKKEGRGGQGARALGTGTD